MLRITVEATGLVRRVTAPRELIVERLCKKEDNGVNIIMFASCEVPPGSISGSSSGGAGHQRRIGRAMHGSSTALALRGGGASSCGAAGKGGWVGPWWHGSHGSNNGSIRSDTACSSSGSKGVQMLGGLGAWLWGWWNPVRATVTGGYTISPCEDAHGQRSPECLVTCIMKVRCLHGILHWTAGHAVANAAVILLKVPCYQLKPVQEVHILVCLQQVVAV